MDHVTSDHSSACSITEEIVHCIITTNSSNILQGVVCVGTAVYTGQVGGVIKS